MTEPEATSTATAFPPDIQAEIEARTAAGQHVPAIGATSTEGGEDTAVDPAYIKRWLYTTSAKGDAATTKALEGRGEPPADWSPEHDPTQLTYVGTENVPDPTTADGSPSSAAATEESASTSSSPASTDSPSNSSTSSAESGGTQDGSHAEAWQQLTQKVQGPDQNEHPQSFVKRIIGAAKELGYDLGDALHGVALDDFDHALEGTRIEKVRGGVAIILPDGRRHAADTARAALKDTEFWWRAD